MAIESYHEPIAPTVEAIDEWRAQGSRKAGEDSYGVNIWTKSSRVRCISGKTHDMDGNAWYYTIRGEGSSNGCREYPVRADKIWRAEGWIVGEDVATKREGAAA